MVRVPTTERQFYNTARKVNTLAAAANALMPAVQQYKQTLLDQQKIKIDTNLTKARIDLDNLNNKYRLANQGNPDNPEAKLKLQQDMHKILSDYGAGIDPIAKMDWERSANKLASGYEIANNDWAFKQRAENVKLDVAENMRLNLDLAFNSGLEGNEIGGLIDLDASYRQLSDYAAKNMGETEAKKLLENYKSDFTTNYVNGLIARDPQAAIDFLANKGNQLAIQAPRKIKALQDMAQKQLDAAKKQYNQQLRVNRQYAYNQYIFNPDKTLEDLEEYRQNFEPDMTEEKYDRMAAMINGGNPDAITVFENYDEALARLRELGSMPDTTLEEREVLLKSAAETNNFLYQTNKAGKIDESEQKELNTMLYKALGDKIFKEQLAKTPSLGTFKSIFRSIDNFGLFSDYGPIDTPAAAIKAKKDIEKTAISTMSRYLQAINSGMPEEADKIYQEGIEAAIRSKYWFLPDLQNKKMVPNETILDIDGKPYLFKGYGAEDIFVEVK